MLDIDFVTKHQVRVEEELAARFGSIVERREKLEELTKIINHAKKLTTLRHQVEALRAQRNVAAKERNISLGKKVKEKLDSVEEKLRADEETLKTLLLELPNLHLEDVPVGDPGKNKVIKEGIKPKSFQFTPKDHLELGERLGIIDTQTAAKVSGTRFGYLKGEAAMLEFALINLAMERLTYEGFVPVIPPALIKSEITAKLGYWNAGGNVNYYLVKDYSSEMSGDKEKELELYLVGTAEHSVVPMHMGDVIPKADLPKRYAAFSPSFRREAGSYGKDTRGIIRVHQFDKVEMVSFTSPEEDEAEFNRLLEIPWRMINDLGLPARQVLLSTQDMSRPAAKTVDIETWFPSQKRYIETHSISTTTDFQARRLETRLINNGKTEYVHILNGTAFAIGRTIAAILDNYQRSDGSVEVPEVLRPYTGFSEIGVG